MLTSAMADPGIELPAGLDPKADLTARLDLRRVNVSNHAMLVLPPDRRGGTAMSSHWITRPIHLFGGGSQVENFREMSTNYPVRVIRRSSRPVPLRSGPSIELPSHFAFEGREMDTAEFLADMETTGLVVLKDDRLVFERYWLGNDQSTQ